MNTKTLFAAIVVIATAAALTALGSLGTAIISPASAQNMSGDGGGGNITAGNMTADTSDSTSTPSGQAGEGSTSGDGLYGGAGI